LVAVGRALLQNFRYQVPSSVREQAMDEDGHLILKERSISPYKPNINPDSDDTENINEEDDDEEETANVVMAEFRLVLDGQGSRQSSTVHALNEMNGLANKITFLHADRYRLVRGLTAAKARLELSDRKEGRLMDHDGIGELFSRQEVEESQPENYGLGFSAAAFSTIPQLTQVYLEKLQPYYSPDRCKSEEHYFEVLSFVAIHAMDRFLDARDLAWTCQCTNTIERLETVYEWMLNHVRLLKQESEIISQDLLDCGEECTDLW